MQAKDVLNLTHDLLVLMVEGTNVLVKSLVFVELLLQVFQDVISPL